MCLKKVLMGIKGILLFTFFSNISFTENKAICEPCSDSEECGGEEDKCLTYGGVGKYCGKACTNHSECGQGYCCHERIKQCYSPTLSCSQKGGCCVLSDCPSRSICSRGRCVPVECVTDLDCPPGKVCQNNRCIDSPPPPGECNTDADCEAEYGKGWTCNPDTRECEPPPLPPPDECTTHADCEAKHGKGWTCNLDTRECEPPPPPDECTTHADCEAKHGKEWICFRGKCVLVKCITDSDCSPGKVCQNNQCVYRPPRPGGCNTNAYCEVRYGKGWICNPSSKECEPPKEECNAEKPCPSGKICNLASKCVDCVLNEDCKEGYICDQSGTCVLSERNGAYGACRCGINQGAKVNYLVILISFVSLCLVLISKKQRLKIKKRCK
jgi:Cys-rich repeat protein